MPRDTIVSHCLTVPYAQTLWDKSLRCGTVYDEATLKGFSIVSNQIWLCICHFWASHKSSSMNEPARHANSLCTLQAVMNWTTHWDKDKSYNRNMPLPIFKRNERATLNVEPSYSNVDRTQLIALKLSSRSTIESHNCRHSRLQKSRQHSTPEHIYTSATSQATLYRQVRLSKSQPSSLRCKPQG